MVTAPQNRQPLTGILALQGGFDLHEKHLKKLKAPLLQIRTPAELALVDRLIIPGGESTVITKLIDRFSLTAPLIQRIKAGMPLLATCAGLILLSESIEGYPKQPTLSILPIKTARNAYGRQIHSFECSLSVPVLGKQPLRAVFIRAPRILSAAPEIEILASWHDEPVLIRQGNIIGAAFHPELVSDTRVHKLFLALPLPS